MSKVAEAEHIRALIAAYPLAWVCAGGEASQLPLIGEFDESGVLVSLIGHLSRRNPLYRQLHSGGTALVLFSGPAAYVSPEHAGKRDWAPTWNYANLKIESRVTSNAQLTDTSLDILIGAMERGRTLPWTRTEIAHRYAKMANAIAGFRATVITAVSRFKLGQDEDDAVYRRVLERHPDREMITWMRRLNADR